MSATSRVAASSLRFRKRQHPGRDLESGSPRRCDCPLSHSLNSISSPCPAKHSVTRALLLSAVSNPFLKFTCTHKLVDYLAHLHHAGLTAGLNYKLHRSRTPQPALVGKREASQYEPPACARPKFFRTSTISSGTVSL